MPRAVTQIAMPYAFANKYELTDLIGAGGMGLVYSAVHPRLGRTVAVKLMRPDCATDAYMLRKFHTEAIVGSQLRHPNLVAVLEFGNTDDTAPYLVMELVRGESLAKLLANEGTFAPHRAATVILDVLAGLAVAHAARIVHGDVKTDNVIIEQQDGCELAKVIDFGLARFLDDATPVRMLSGTPEYVAPEVIEGALPTPASDVYGVGVVLYELLTGATPFTGTTMAEILARHLDDDVIPPSLRNPDADIPHALETLVMRALARDPRARFADASQFATALAAAIPARAEASHITRRPVFAAERPTVPIPEALPRQRAAGTQSRAPLSELGNAIADRDVAVMVDRYLGLARALVDARELAAAVEQLEQAVDLMTGGLGAAASDAPEPVWRILLTLAALYDGLGNRISARRAALDAQAQATRCNSAVGYTRARGLLERLGQRSATT